MTTSPTTDRAALDAVLAALREVAPELADVDVGTADRLRDDLDLDSMDGLDVMEGVTRRTGVAITEADRGRLLTVGDVVAHVRAGPG